MRTCFSPLASVPGVNVCLSSRDQFRARFQRSLRNCVRRRFSVAECFGVIWLETLEEISLNDEDQADLYEELIGWAKHRLFPEVLQTLSGGETNPNRSC
jgi:hypothetical protein